MRPMTAWLALHPVIQKALWTATCGVVGAVVIDAKILLKDSSWSQFFTDWNWRVATFRYAQGFVGSIVASLTASGVIAMIG